MAAAFDNGDGYSLQTAIAQALPEVLRRRRKPGRKVKPKRETGPSPTMR